MDDANRIERRIKLHDLRVVVAIARLGSMGKAASYLHTSQPAVSRSIAELEHTVGARLFERERTGVRPTEYGRALIESGFAVFDVLNEGIKNIQFLTNPAKGEVRIGCSSPMSSYFLPSVFDKIFSRHPDISIHTTEIATFSHQCEELRNRNVDFVLGRLPQRLTDDIETEALFYDSTYVVASARNLWTRRRKVLLKEISRDRWAMPPLNSVVGESIADAFRRSGITFPPSALATGSIQFVSTLAENGTHLAILPHSVWHFAQRSKKLRRVGVDLQIPRWPVGAMRLKKRPFRPVVALVVDQIRKSSRALAAS